MFTAEEKARIKHFLSYPDWSSLSQAIQLGYPAATQPAFLLDDAFHRMTPAAETSIRRDLCECEDIERQLSAARKRMRASKIDKVELNPHEPNQLRRELTFWALRLASDLGVMANAASAFEYAGGGGGGLNARTAG